MSKSFEDHFKHSKFRAWDQKENSDLDTKDLIKKYESGYAGCAYDPESEEELLGSVEFPYAEDAAYHYGFVGSGKGKLVFPIKHVLDAFPTSFPGVAQTRGSCVSDCGARVSLCTMVLESVLGLPDEISGRVEETPDISETGIKNNALSFETSYWHRGHGSDGWYCSALAKVLTSKSGAVIRKNYPEVDIDLETYSGRLAGKWGRTPPPQDIQDAFDNNLFRTATKVRTFEEAADFLSRGFFITTCGSQGWANERDENGFSRRRGSWAHALSATATDDRPEIHSKYGEPLVLVTNSWGAYNKDRQGLRKVYGTNLTIPDGSFWAKWSDFKNRDMYAISGLNGWARKELPDLSPGFV